MEAPDTKQMTVPTGSLDAASNDAVSDISTTITAAHDTSPDPPMAATAAHNAVFSTPKLLEAIISSLHLRDILTKAPLVSPAWKKVIDESPALQTKLWRRPQASKAATPAGFSRPFPWMMFMGVSETIDGGWPVYDVKITHNPMGEDGKYACSHAVMLDPSREASKGDVRTHSVYLSIPNGRSNAVRPTSLDMYLTEPPITVAELELQVPHLELLSDDEGPGSVVPARAWFEHPKCLAELRRV